MEIVRINSVYELLFGAKLIGYGTTAICFLLRDNTVLKLFINTHHKRSLFKFRDIVEHLSSLEKLNNETYVAPRKLVMIGDEVVAYIMDYRKAKTMKRISNSVRVNDLLMSYPKLLEDTRSVSLSHFRISDMHDKNILFNGDYHVIDLDNGSFIEDYKVDDLTRYNMQDILLTIVDGMFGVSWEKDIFFNRSDLDRIYHDTVYKNPEDFSEFVHALEEEIKVSNPSVLDLKRNRSRILTLQTRHNYYNRY